MGAGNRGLHPCIAGGCRSHANRLAAWIDIQQIMLLMRVAGQVWPATLCSDGRRAVRIPVRTILSGAFSSVAECKR